MVFSSLIFIFLFLPIVFIINSLIKKEYSNYFLFLASLVFYAWGEPFFVLLMFLSTVINWFCGKRIGKSAGVPKKIWLFIAVAADLSLLFYYKYLGFFAGMLDGIVGKGSINVPDIILPIGISFFTFQAISYVVDIYRGEVEASSNFVNTALYISFFPQLIAGPIVKYKDINQQIVNRSVTWVKTAEGIRRFIYGLAKKVLIANILGLCVDKIHAYNIASIDPLTAWFGAIAYTFQIYYDFSGYSDMAIGLGKMFGFDFLENFNYPYLSASISEFWKRWHISLGSWFKDYLYIPLGGNRKGKARTYINLCIVFLLTGLWHGAEFSFILWGIYHGIFEIIERLGFKKFLDKYRVIGTIYCFLIVNFGWVLFRAQDTATGLTYLGKMVCPWIFGSSHMVYGRFIDAKTVFVLALAFVGAGLLQFIVPSKLKERWKNSLPEAICCTVLLLLSVLYLVSDTYNPFIYFQF